MPCRFSCRLTAKNFPEKALIKKVCAVCSDPERELNYYLDPSMVEYWKSVEAVKESAAIRAVVKIFRRFVKYLPPNSEASVKRKEFFATQRNNRV